MVVLAEPAQVLDEARASAGGETHGRQQGGERWPCAVACAASARLVLSFALLS